jgi:anti-sigma B factor antagonist
LRTGRRAGYRRSTRSAFALYPEIVVSEPLGVPFEIDVSSVEDNVKVVALRGELDFDKAPDLGRVLDELRADGEREVVIDLSELTFIDSSGISVLVGAARSAAAEKGTLVVAGPTPPVRRVFDIVSLSQLVAIEPGLESALQRIGWRREQTAG